MYFRRQRIQKRYYPHPYPLVSVACICRKVCFAVVVVLINGCSSYSEWLERYAADLLRGRYEVDPSGEIIRFVILA